jgi:hypothetical protein
MSRPLFTPKSARRAVTALRPAAERMCRLYREMERRRPPRIVPEQPVERAYFALVWRLNNELARIYRRGARVGDLRSGRLSFPAMRDGKRVWLCWEVGEPSLRHWRESGAGERRLQPVDEDGPWEEAD